MNKEYSRILRFDFPTIPILGSVLLILIFFNDRSLVWFIFDTEGRPIVSVIAATVGFLGAAGITVSQLISFSFFDRFYGIKNWLLKSRHNSYGDTANDWFRSLCEELVPRVRTVPRGDNHCLLERKRLRDLSPGQMQATIHALEVNCREKHPEISTQIEYFYSMYTIFSMLGLLAISLPFLVTVNLILNKFGFAEFVDLSISGKIFVFDLLVAVMCWLAALHARRFKEHLRMKLLNSMRVHVVTLLSSWFQVDLPNK
ncbi:hypothetical protein [Thiobacillus sp.]|uniref:hypothetical protein n=1 Tax=Thiobacillus sp. TaxID=924 RepID=UPI0025E614D1|nr:hypothetical protein [Thiobacillus sp.]MBT9540140.1 hypothetical protein [Thiobacillus sp.]